MRRPAFLRTFTLAVLFAALPVHGTIILQLGFGTELLSGSDDGGFDNATFHFEVAINQPTYYNSGGYAHLNPDYVLLTVSGSSVPGNNGSFYLGEVATGTFRIFPNVEGQAYLLRNAADAGAVADFGTTGLFTWDPSGAAVANPALSGPILQSDFAGILVNQPGTIEITGSTYTFNNFTTNVPEPRSVTVMLGALGLLGVALRRRR